MKKPYIVCIIPARGGSKGVLGKNIKDLNGKPLIAYTIEAALKSEVFDDVVVTTDSEEIADISRKSGARAPFLRPAHLASDTAHTPPAVEHAVSFIENEKGINVDVVCTLQPTSPLRNYFHIQEALQEYLKSGKDALISVKESFPPWWMWTLNNGKAELLLKLESGDDPYLLERQELPPAYQPNGAIYFTKREKLKEGRIVIAESMAIYVMDRESSLDVDTPVDFMVIEHVLKSKNV